jgi:hypothetical protein
MYATLKKAAAQNGTAQHLTKWDAYDRGFEAYLYLYPLVTMEVIRRQMTNSEPDKRPGFGQMNAFSHMRAFPPADFKTVARPNFDTLCSSAWLDLTKEPAIVSVPNTHGRYYQLPMLDMWTDVFAAPGTRTSGTAAAAFAVVPWGWHGAVPPHVQRISAPTPYVWVIGCTQTDGIEDYTAVHRVQDGFQVVPLSQWDYGAEPLPPVDIDARVDMTTRALDQVNGMPASSFFALAAELMALHPPHSADWSMVARMRRIGLEASKPFKLAALDPLVAQALEPVPAGALHLMKEKLPTLARDVNGWQMPSDSVGVHGNSYLRRALVALAGLVANQPVDTIYPLARVDVERQPLTGENDYVLHFAPSDLPPVDAFWSLTMYDAQGFPVGNGLNRFALSDRDSLQFNVDGSLDLYIQLENPGPHREANWLPTPHGPMSLCLRLYAPRPHALDGRWNPPAIAPVRRAGGSGDGAERS